MRARNADGRSRMRRRTLAGVVFGLVLTGILAWHFQLEGARLKGNLLMHLIFGWLATLLMWTVVFLYRRTESRWVKIRYAVQFVTAIVISITGHLGGFVSGVNGAG